MHKLSAQGLLTALNVTRNTVLCRNLETAGGLLGRGRGLLGRDSLAPESGMLFEAGRLTPYMMMHMFFMRFALDIVFLDRAGKVLKINHNLRPWRVSSLVFGAGMVLELGAGAASKAATAVGDMVSLVSQ